MVGLWFISPNGFKQLCTNVTGMRQWYSNQFHKFCKTTPTVLRVWLMVINERLSIELALLATLSTSFYTHVPLTADLFTMCSWVNQGVMLIVLSRFTCSLHPSYVVIASLGWLQVFAQCHIDTQGRQQHMPVVHVPGMHWVTCQRNVTRTSVDFIKCKSKNEKSYYDLGHKFQWFLSINVQIMSLFYATCCAFPSWSM